MTPVRKVFRIASALPVVLLAAACGDDPAPPAGAPSPSPSATAPSPVQAPAGDPAARAAAVVAGLADEDLAGQVLMPYAYGNSATAVDKVSAAGNQRIGGVDTPAELVAKFRLGGLILVSFTAGDPTADTNPATNVENPQQVRAFTAGLQGAAGKLPAQAPLLIGTDQEYGVVTRVRDGVTMLPSAMGLAAARQPRLTEAAWRAAGTELAAMGITVDFAPVADTLGAQGSSVIGSRSYGDDPKANAAQVAAAVRGLQGAGVAAALKHFPGHGHTTGDSHDELPVVAQSRAALQRQDWPPFAAGIDAGAGVVMSGHLDLTAIDPGVPATFSHKIMTDVLRDQLKFTGVAVTDAMNMAPAKKWPAGEAAVRALNAGNDVLLMPPDLAAARDGILAGLKDGSLPRPRLVEAVTRILTLKFRTAGQPQPELSVLGSAEHQRAVLAADAASITVLRGRCSGPLVTGPVTVTASGGRELARSTLVAALQEAGVQVQPSGGTVVHLVGYGDRRADLSNDAAITVGMDAPYLLSAARSPTVVATYSSSKLSLTALAAVIAGRAKAPGRSPVAVSGLPRSACAD
ncbi:glycoside hydrolase family 3 protein [Krasilnikovia sp. MM14-A1004]|uniref:glycoside hydrolase family 3 protein n=1 Tax=Krasilnikovia sp. MM14-A1004 TaxID=3373541 RepID=UPI00399CBC9D